MNLLKMARYEKGLTIQKTADLAGISKSYYGMIEKGDRTPTYHVAEALAKVLEIDTRLVYRNHRD